MEEDDMPESEEESEDKGKLREAHHGDSFEKV